MSGDTNRYFCSQPLPEQHPMPAKGDVWAERSISSGKHSRGTCLICNFDMFWAKC